MRTLLTILFLSLSFAVSAQVSNINLDSMVIVKRQSEPIKLEHFINKITLLKAEVESLKKVSPTDEDYKELSKSLNSKKREIKKYEAKIKRLEQKRWFPSSTSNSIERDSLFKSLFNKDFTKTNFLNSVSYFIGKDTDLIQTDLVSDNIGPVLVSFGSVLNTENKDDNEVDNSQEQDIERLLTSGGNFYLNFDLPVYKNYNQTFVYYNALNLRLASDIEGFGNDIETSDFNASLGLSNNFLINSNNSKFNFLIQIDSNLFLGTKDFMQNLDVDTDVFFNTNLNFGLTIEKKIRLSFRTNFASEPSLRTEKIAVGLQLIK